MKKLDQSKTTNRLKAIMSLVAMPNCRNVKRLKNDKSGYRLRVGFYRALFNWAGIVHIVFIEEVKR